MKNNRIQSVTLALLLILAGGSFSRADDSSTAASTTDTRLREALRDTVAQLRDAQNQNFTLQTAQAQSEKDNADLKAKLQADDDQIKALTTQAVTQKAASDQSIADLNGQVADLTGQTQRLTDAIKQWKDAYNQVAQLQAATEAQRVQFAAKAAAAQRLVDDRESKNFELYKVGSEILNRYEQFSLGEALEAKEPFIGLTRIKLENLVQDYNQRLLDHVVTTTGQPAAPNGSASVAVAKPEMKHASSAPQP
jgi:chromosome segregation ATPase